MKIRTMSVCALLAALNFGGVVCAASDISNVPQAAAVSTTIESVNINKASAFQIEGKVKGIGLKRAEAIVAYRNEHGAYKSLDDLANVKGLGETFVKSHMDALKKVFTLS